MHSSLRIVTLNCWGIPFVSHQKNRRISAIIETIKNSNWDVVALQEVWLAGDQEKIRSQTGYEYSMVFKGRGRLLGSGLMILSRFKILDHDFHSFKVTGFPHRVLEGDFHASKGVGYALLQTPLGEVPLFVTHLIAKYSRRHEHDTNRVFRMAQVLELLFYIRRMATPKGFILCGDLNAMDQDLEVEALYALAGASGRIQPGPKVKKIDHILCGATHEKIQFRISRIKMSFVQPFNRSPFLYSDHPGVEAEVRPADHGVDTRHTLRILERTLRYMKYSMEVVRQIDRRIRLIPVVGWICGFFMKPQLEFIAVLLDMLAMDIKQNEPEHPLRLFHSKMKAF